MQLLSSRILALLSLYYTVVVWCILCAKFSNFLGGKAGGGRRRSVTFHCFRSKGAEHVSVLCVPVQDLSAITTTSSEKREMSPFLHKSKAKKKIGRKKRYLQHLKNHKDRKEKRRLLSRYFSIAKRKTLALVNPLTIFFPHRKGLGSLKAWLCTCTWKASFDVFCTAVITVHARTMYRVPRTFMRA